MLVLHIIQPKPNFYETKVLQFIANICISIF